MINLSSSFAMGLFIVITLNIVSVNAQADGDPGHGPPPFSVFDMDENGFVSESEFESVHAQRLAARASEGKKMHCAASAPAFSDLDSDGDGQLNEGELIAGQKAHRAECRAMGLGAGRAGQGSLPTFKEFDLDGDGVIIEAEFDEAHANRMSERAAQGRQLKNAGDTPGFSGIDSNGDDVISEEEFADHLATHHQDMRKKQ